MKAFLSGIGSYVPEKVLTNADLEKMVQTSDAWIRERTGIRERRIAEAHVATSDMAAIAAKRALESAGTTAKELEAIIVATATPDMMFPSTACLVQTKINARHILSFDLEAGCSGFVYGLAVADSLIKNGMNNVLVIGAELLSKITDYTDRGTCVLLADGAGAVVLKNKNHGGEILSWYLAANGAEGKLLHQPAGGSKMPATHDTVGKGLHYLKMKGNEVFKIAVRAMGEAAIETIKRAHVTADKIDLLIPHQANIRIIEATAKRLGLPMEKVFVNIDKYGNTSSASIPIALDEALKQGRIKKGDLILFVAFGAGFTWGGVLVKW